VRTLFRQRRQALHALRIEGGQARAAPAVLFVVTLNGAMRVEVILHHRHAYLARRAHRLFELLNLRIAPRPAVKRVRKAADHQIAQRKTALLQFVQHRAKLIFFPRHAWTA
jgi:hypothetical protein